MSPPPIKTRRLEQPTQSHRSITRKNQADSIFLTHYIYLPLFFTNLFPPSSSLRPDLLNREMGPRFWLVFLVLALATVVGSCSSAFGHVEAVSRFGTVGDSIGEDDEMMVDSEINHRLLAQKRYISYGALKKNSVPCNRRGQSYYNCNRMKKANPYRRGCSVITHCQRTTD